ncbi:MAG: hypothetical protein MUC92_04095 [Fimbriimonadaceae bacterium]|nr:hypothetical protein [Fimbriimonadaceae bacterium]
MVATLALAFTLNEQAPGVWTPLPLISAEMRAKGIAGGEGGQWPRSMAVSADGSFLIHALDVSGMFRSLDGGNTWEPTNVGFTPRGTASVAIDPLNPNRVLVAAANSSGSPQHGLYLSVDRAASWKHVLPATYAANYDIRDQIAFGTDSWSQSIRGSSLVLWSRIAKDTATWNAVPDDPALFRSYDGGVTWARVPTGRRISGSILRADPGRKNAFYALNPEGLLVSTDAGSRFSTLLSGTYTGFDVSRAQPNSLWVSGANELHFSQDRGKTWRAYNAPSKPAEWKFSMIKVSPADAQRVFVWAHHPERVWEASFWVTHNGGGSWFQATKDATNAFLPQNGRQGFWVWHPRNKDVAWSWGGDWATKSTDGGRTLRWSSSGINQVLVGGKWNFNSIDPNLIFFGSQDYNGAVTSDAGKTWTYLNPAGLEWGGFCYGGYAASRQVLVVGNASGWSAPRTLRVSRDGGATWRDTGLEFKGLDTSYGIGNVVFASDLRSPDMGVTWNRMEGCHGVIGATPDRTKLYGVRRGETHAIVVSMNQGLTWQVAAEAPGEVHDLAYDHVRNIFYAVINDRLMSVSNGSWSEIATPKDSLGGVRLRTVAVDPVDPRVIYGGSANHLTSSSVAVIRSLDSGKTWTVLTRQAPLDGRGLDGGREAETIRVHPVTREPFVATSCYGWWKFSAP